MSEWIRAILDLLMIGLVGAGLVQAARLMKHLVELQKGRADMERFVHEFNATVLRAEAGIKGLRTAARETGDDLEKLVEKAGMVRDELQFLTESADQIANRLSQSASNRVQPDPAKPAAAPAAPAVAAPAPEASPSSVTPMPTRKAEPAPSSRAEKELLQALQKLS